MQACRYGNALASESSIGLEMLFFCTASSISALKRQSALGVVIKKRMVALIAVAVVSDPANLFRSRSVYNNLACWEIEPTIATKSPTLPLSG